MTLPGFLEFIQLAQFFMEDTDFVSKKTTLMSAGTELVNISKLVKFNIFTQISIIFEHLQI